MTGLAWALLIVGAWTVALAVGFIVSGRPIRLRRQDWDRHVASARAITETDWDTEYRALCEQYPLS